MSNSTATADHPTMTFTGYFIVSFIQSGKGARKSWQILASLTAATAEIDTQSMLLRPGQSAQLSKLC